MQIHDSSKSIYLLLAVLVLLKCSWAGAQIPRNHTYFELGGPGLFATVHYERNFKLSETDHFAASAGYGLDRYLPLSITYNMGKQKHFFETGFGVTLSNTRPHDDHYAHFIAGYKRMVLNNLSMKLRFTGLVELEDPLYSLLPWLGLGLGYAF